MVTQQYELYEFVHRQIGSHKAMISVAINSRFFYRRLTTNKLGCKCNDCQNVSLLRSSKVTHAMPTEMSWLLQQI